MGGLTTAGAIAAALREAGAHRRAERRRRVAARHRHVAAVADGHRLEAVRVLEDPAGRPRRVAATPASAPTGPSDDRYIALILLQSDKHWDDFVEAARQARDGHRPAVLRLDGPRPRTPPSASRLHGRGVREPAAVALAARRSTASTACGARSRRSTSSTRTRR